MSVFWVEGWTNSFPVHGEIHIIFNTHHCLSYRFPSNKVRRNYVYKDIYFRYDSTSHLYHGVLSMYKKKPWQKRVLISIQGLVISPDSLDGKYEQTSCVHKWSWPLWYRPFVFTFLTCQWLYLIIARFNVVTFEFMSLMNQSQNFQKINPLGINHLMLKSVHSGCIVDTAVWGCWPYNKIWFSLPFSN